VKTQWVPCNECGGADRKHRILFEKTNPISSLEEGWQYDEHHQLLECMGCESIRYRRYCIGDNNSGEYGERELYNIEVFPSAVGNPAIRPVRDFGHDDELEPLVPENVVKMYRETILALNSGARTLAGGGLRATVEAICLAKEITAGTLQVKIDALVSQGLLTEAQANLLHEERYLGNAALHELATPSKSDIEDGLQIVEGLIQTIYVLPAKAGRLRAKREANAKKKAAKRKQTKKPRTKRP
jgi:hypothetical protein